MEFHAPSFGDGFDLNQYTTVGQNGVPTTSYYVPSTQSFVQAAPGLYNPAAGQVAVSEADMMAFGHNVGTMWTNAHTQAAPVYTQTLTNLSGNMQSLQSHLQQQGQIQQLQTIQLQQHSPQTLSQPPTSQSSTPQPQASPSPASASTTPQPQMNHQNPQSQEVQRESSPMAGSPDSYGTSSGGGPIKTKQKAVKKKKDPNEPKKPLSAYAMFFRDTQAAIKGQNPSASFGEVSKIVASMWEALEVEKKNSYKQKAEDAKKEYLKALTAYKASLVASSPGTPQEQAAPSPPQTTTPQPAPSPSSVQMSAPVLSQPTVMIESHHPAQWAAQQMAQQPQQPMQIIYAHSTPHGVQQLTAAAAQGGEQFISSSNTAKTTTSQNQGLLESSQLDLSQHQSQTQMIGSGQQQVNQIHEFNTNSINVQVPISTAQRVTVGQPHHSGLPSSPPHQHTVSPHMVSQQQVAQSQQACHLPHQQQQLLHSSNPTDRTTPSPSAGGAAGVPGATPSIHQSPSNLMHPSSNTTTTNAAMTSVMSASVAPAQALSNDQQHLSSSSLQSQSQMHHHNIPHQVVQMVGDQSHQQQMQSQMMIHEQHEAQMSNLGHATPPPTAQGQHHQMSQQQQQQQQNHLQQLQHQQDHNFQSMDTSTTMHHSMQMQMNQMSNGLSNGDALHGGHMSQQMVGSSTAANMSMSSEAPHGSTLSQEMGSMLKTKCIRHGCVNPAIDSADWDKEYCSNECVVSHCREVFDNWVGQRQASQPTGPPVVSQ